jgi:hypothetical protein
MVTTDSVPLFSRGLSIADARDWLRSRTVVPLTTEETDHG